MVSLLNIEMTSAVWYAVLLYILGMAVIVYLRPSFMFKPSGVWKEFGLSEGYTLFPFWMFALTWAILSYAFVTLGSVFVSTLVAKSQEMTTYTSNMNLNTGPVATPISRAPMNIISTIAPAAMAASTIKLPGYYILENLPEGPKYVYWGTEAPTEKNVIVRQYHA